MTKEEFDYLFIQKEAGIRVSSTPERTAVNAYYRVVYDCRCFSNEYNATYPIIVCDDGNLVGWTGGKSGSYKKCDTIISFDEFYAMVSFPEDEISTMENLV